MLYIIMSLLLFSAAVILHILFCRMHRGQGLQAKAFVFIAIFLFLFYVSVVVCTPSMGFLDPDSMWGLPFKMTAGLMYLLLVPVYLCFYVLTQLVSPSKRILQAVTDAKVVTLAQMWESVETEKFIPSRLNELKTSGCIEEHQGRFTLTRAGQKIARILDFMQAVLGRDIGG